MLCLRTRLCLSLALTALFGTTGLSAERQPDWPKVEQHAIELLKHYVTVRSVNPPADTRQTAELLRSELAAGGIAAQLYESAPGKVNLLARLPGKDRTLRPLLLLNHMDVVPVDPSRWQHSPFGAEESEGYLWGRGSLDMKSTGVVQLATLMQFKKLGIMPARDIVFLATCDEESDGTFGAKWMIEHHWDELNPEYVMDEGGLGSRDLYSPGKLVFGVSVGDKQVLWLKMRVTGTSGHASQPTSDNPNDTLMAAVTRAREFRPSKRPNNVVEGMRGALGTFADNKFMHAVAQNTMSLTTLRSGVGDPPKVNVIPSVAEATLDCRLLPGESAEEFLSEIKARVNDKRVSFEMLSHPADPGPSRTDTPLFRAIAAAIRKSHPDATVVPTIIPYGTDTQKFRLRGALGYGLMPFVVDAATVATMHSDSERLPLDEFRKALHLYFDILRADW